MERGSRYTEKSAGKRGEKRRGRPEGLGRSEVELGSKGRVGLENEEAEPKRWATRGPAGFIVFVDRQKVKTDPPHAPKSANENTTSRAATAVTLAAGVSWRL